jgi:hypothetical protein
MPTASPDPRMLAEMAAQQAGVDWRGWAIEPTPFPGFRRFSVFVSLRPRVRHVNVEMRQFAYRVHDAVEAGTIYVGWDEEARTIWYDTH